MNAGSSHRSLCLYTIWTEPAALSSSCSLSVTARCGLQIKAKAPFQFQAERLNSFTHWIIYIKKTGETDTTRSLCTSANTQVKKHTHIRPFSCRDSLIWPRSPPEIKCCLCLLQSQATKPLSKVQRRKISKCQLCGAVQKWLSIREGHLLMISCHERQRSSRWFD